MALATFSPEAAYLVTATNDGRVKLWDVANNKLENEFTEKDHLAANYTCVAWGAAPSPSKKGKRRRAAARSSTPHLVALGTERGVVVVWDLAAGEVVHRLGEGGGGHTSAVKDVCFTADCTKLLSSSLEKYALVWDLSTGAVDSKLRAGKHGASRVAMSSKLSILAGTHIRTYAAAGTKLGSRIDAHQEPVSALALSSDEAVFVSAAPDRSVCVWRSPAEDDDGDDTTSSLQLLSTPSAATVATVAAVDSASYRVAAPCEDGKCRLWQFTGKGGKAPQQPGCTVATPGRGQPIFAATFEAGRAGASVVVAAGSLNRPSFHTVAVESDAGTLVPKAVAGGVAPPVAAQANGNGVHASDSEDSDATPRAGAGVDEGDDDDFHATKVLGAAHMASVRETMDADGASKRRRLADDGDDGGDVGADLEDFEEFELALAEGQDGDDGEDDDDDDDDLGLDEETLEERLAALTRALEEDEDGEEDEEDAELAAAEAARVARLVDGAVTNVSSLSSLLMQALQTNDAAQLEMCLSITDGKAIEETVDRLPASKVVQFLHSVIAKFEARPSRGVVLARWIRAVLVKHTAHLMAVPDLVKRLSALYQTIDSRLAVFKKLLTLSGRLDIVLSQVAQQSRTKPAAPGTGAPTFVVHEDDDDVAEESGSGDSDGSGDGEDSSEDGSGSDSDDGESSD